MLASPWLVQFCLFSTRGLRSSWLPWTLRVLLIARLGGRASCVTYGMSVYMRELLNFLNPYHDQLVFLRVLYAWSPLLFNLYTRLISSVVNHSQLFSYANNHTVILQDYSIYSFSGSGHLWVNWFSCFSAVWCGLVYRICSTQNYVFASFFEGG